MAFTRFFPRVLAIALLILDCATALTTKVSTVWEFDAGIWAENLAVRPNGEILVTVATEPYLYLVDPTGRRSAELLYSFPNVAGTAGIAELPAGSDIYYLAAGNATPSADTVFVKGSWSIWRVDLSKHRHHAGKAVVSQVAAIPEASFFNGVTNLNNKYALVGESSSGTIYRVDPATAEVVVISTDPLLAPPAGARPAIGVNGLKARNNKLFWTNTATSIIASVPVYPNGTALEAATVIANATSLDDFIFYENGFVLAGNDDARKIVPGGDAVVLSNSTLLEGSTAVAHAATSPRGKEVFYFTTNGGAGQYFAGNPTNPGKVVKVVLEY